TLRRSVELVGVDIGTVTVCRCVGVERIEPAPSTERETSNAPPPVRTTVTALPLGTAWKPVRPLIAFAIFVATAPVFAPPGAGADRFRPFASVRDTVHTSVG